MLRLPRFDSVWVNLSEIEVVKKRASPGEADVRAAKQELHQMHETHASRHSSAAGQGKHRVAS